MDLMSIAYTNIKIAQLLERIGALGGVRITYDANGGSGAMTDPNAPYEQGTPVRVMECEFTPPEGSEFISWNINPSDASYPSTYVPGDYYILTSNITLHALWG